MKHIRSFLCLLLLSGLGTTMHAQSTISATGGNASGTGGNLSYTIGQVAYMTISGITGTVTQGVQQPYEISVVSALEEAKDINPVSYTHLRAHETRHDLVCRLLLEKK